MSRIAHTAATSHHENKSARKRIAEIIGDEQLSSSEAVVACVKQFANERPEVVALWSFGIGFVVGWKLKPW